MLQRRGASTGIDVGSHAVKLVRLDERDGKAVCTHWGREPIGQGAPATAGSQALKSLFKRLKLSSRKLGHVAVAVGSTEAVVRQAAMPTLSVEDMAQSIRFEARKHLPLESMPEPIIDYQVLSSSALPEGAESDGSSPVLMAAVPTKIRNDLLQTLRRAGVDPDVVDLHPLPAVNALLAVHDNGGLTAPLGIVDLGTSSRSLAVSYPGGELYTRNLEFDDAGEVGLSAEGPARALTRQLSDTLRFLNVRNRKHPVEALLLCGGGALAPQLVERLAGGLGVAVTLPDPFIDIAFASDTPSAEDRVTFVSALGLALWGADVQD